VPLPEPPGPSMVITGACVIMPPRNATTIKLAALYRQL